jgi:glutamate-1-semialdehyde 2,1-aminomutase
MMTPASKRPLLTTRSRSLAYHDKASCVIAGGVNSNVRLLGQNPPLCFACANGPYLTDLDGNNYIDYALGMGPSILGHAPRVVTDAVARSLEQGQLYAGQSRLELELARRLQEHLPSAELVRLGTTGSEMVQTALRLARAATGRSRLVKFAGHYHGWLDNILTNDVTFYPDSLPHTINARPQTGGQSENALSDTVVLPWNDLAVLRAYTKEFGTKTAAIIMEPVLCNTGVIPPTSGYVEGVRALCDEHGIVFIVDEVITGFRLGLRGAQGVLGISGDLSIYAKALGGGFPIAALTGRRSLMSLIGSGTVNNSGTYNSNVVGLSAAIATFDTLASEQGEVYTRIGVVGQSLIDGMRALAKAKGDNLLVQGYPSVFNTCFSESSSISTVESYRCCDEARQGRFIAALLERGVRPMARGTWFVSAAHTEIEVQSTLDAVHDALDASRCSS